ncbi:MAG: aminoglycoside phosphotransferase family protein [Bacilli bacterium]|nr:aminoglycoside phosphotransferase family protein [Bacilli bacterium]
MNEKIKNIVEKFNFEGNPVNIVENSQGNINSTYMITLDNNQKFLIQKINSYVFKEPYVVMRNIDLVTEHIKKKLRENKDTTHKTLNIIKTKDNQNLFTYINGDGEKEYYRAYEFIDNCISYNNFDECKISKEKAAYNAGKCFGFFHKLLSDFPTSMLVDTIPDFHNTPKRFNDLLMSIENNITNRAFRHSIEIIDLISKIKECSIIWDSLGKNIPVRVTHNDTKLNNILMDKDTNEGVAVIDLDTVMKGSVLFDIGDGIRSACSNSFEDELDPNKIFLNLEITKSYLNGYLEEMGPYLEKDEITYIGLSIKTLTYELVLRFLTDYINGDIYFKIKYPEHNKDRFMNQYILLNDINKKMEEIDEYVNTLYKKQKNNQYIKK